MISLILTVLYLAKDTVHRWFARLSSPLARVLVVFFLSFCALLFLGSYVISAKVMRDRIRAQGGDLVQVVITPRANASYCLPSPHELREMFGVEALSVYQVASMKPKKGSAVSVLTYDFNCSAAFLPHLATNGAPTLLQPADGPHKPGPATFYLNGQPVEVVVRNLPADHLALRLLSRKGAIVVQPDSPLAGDAGSLATRQLLMRVAPDAGVEEIRRLVNWLETFFRLEGVEAHPISALPLLEEMDVILGNQTQCRIGFCLGIACIVGILLTALAGMEYRQNEYIYTLMKSFGIHPFLLVAAFIVENIILVGLSFVAAVAAFLHFQSIIVSQFFKLGSFTLTAEEIMPELQLIAVSLLGCILLSSLPIIAAAHRDIGRVLK